METIRRFLLCLPLSSVFRLCRPSLDYATRDVQNLPLLVTFLLGEEQADICPGQIARIPFVLMHVEVQIVFCRITSPGCLTGAFELPECPLHAGNAGQLS